MLLAYITLLFSHQAMAWDKHQVLLQHLLDSKASKHRIYPYQKISIPCPEQEKAELKQLADTLHINAAKVPIFSQGRCKPGQTSTEIVASDLMLAPTIDEPDFGMDQDLPDSDDPKHDRKYMGGSTGPTSQGFRHMFFKGLDLFSFYSTFQFPFGAMGQAIERVKSLHEISEAYFTKGDKFWGTRTLLWQLHYIQDLQQPFHVVQIPALSMVPWGKFLHSFVKETSHSVANYHYAYEGFALALMNESATNQFDSCFEPEDEFEVLKDNNELVSFPRTLSHDVGIQVHELFGDEPKSESVDLPNGVGAIDYFALLHLVEPPLLPEEEQKMLSKEERKLQETQRRQFKAVIELKKLTCQLIHRVASLTWYELDRSELTPSGSAAISNKSAK